jgi:hypothetical protein
MSVETKTLLGLLEDGQWHPLREIAQKLEATIAPGKALRRYETRAANREALEGPRRAPELSEDEKIASGRRTLANVTINSLKKRHVELVDTPQARMIRIRPEIAPSQPPKVDTPPSTTEPGVDPMPLCPRCGAWMYHAQVHEQWHRETDQPLPPPAPAFPPPLREADITRIVREQIQAALDEYQRGMQAFLLDRFADLEIAILRSKLPLGLRGNHGPR